ncbi:hypothetical protein DFH09DRAFT_1096265 [Mycena vulgaris]|nr:hypothetical protein DFH09DRAFT_1096265 [Mycena vulgaris]
MGPQASHSPEVRVQLRMKQDFIKPISAAPLFYQSYSLMGRASQIHRPGPAYCLLDLRAVGRCSGSSTLRSPLINAATTAGSSEPQQQLRQRWTPSCTQLRVLSPRRILPRNPYHTTLGLRPTHPTGHLVLPALDRLLVPILGHVLLPALVVYSVSYGSSETLTNVRYAHLPRGSIYEDDSRETICSICDYAPTISCVPRMRRCGCEFARPAYAPRGADEKELAAQRLRHVSMALPFLSYSDLPGVSSELALVPTRSPSARPAILHPDSYHPDPLAAAIALYACAIHSALHASFQNREKVSQACKSFAKCSGK